MPTGAEAPKSVSTSALVTEAAKQLNVARTDLKAAIVQSAEARVDAAVDGRGHHVGRRRPAEGRHRGQPQCRLPGQPDQHVAANLKITTKDLNAGFRAARKALASKAIDTALANGDITADQATAAKTALDSKTFAGYKSGGVANLTGYADGGGGGGQCGGGGSNSSSSSSSGTSSSDTSTTATTTAFRVHR